MSARNMSSATDTTRKSGRIVEPYQPVWMAHWMRGQGNVAAERRNHSAFGNEDFNHVPRDDHFSHVLDASRPVKEIKAVESKVFGTVQSSENVRTCWPLTNHGRGTDNEGALRLELGHMVERGKAVAGNTRSQIPSVISALNRGCNSLGEGTSKNPLDWVKTHSPTMDRSLTALKPSKETFVGSSTNLQPCYDLEKHEFGNGKAVKSPLVMRPSSSSNNHLPNTNIRMLVKEHWDKHNESTDFICERKMDRDLNKSLLLDAPSTSDHHLQLAGPDSFREMQKSSGIPLLPSQFIASEKTESKKSHYNFYSLQKLPNCVVNDTETMRICTTVDSVEATPGGFPRFSKTTHSLLITKKTDANLSKKVFRTTQFITDVNGNMPRDVHSLWPFSAKGNRGVKLQPLSSSSNSEEKVNVEDAKTLRNESSADTDTMDVDFCKEEEWNDGAECYPSTKPQVDAATLREEGCHSKKTGRLDINLELPALPAIASSPENARASSSRTQSLEMDMLLAHAEHPKRKSNPCVGDSSETDPIMRWVKRLKLISPNSSSQGTKSPTLAENPSTEQVGKFFRKILDSGIASSEPTLSNHHSKESISLNKNSCRYLSGHNEEPSANVMEEEDQKSLLSHVWIKRWLRNGSETNKKKPETSLPSEPTSSKSTPDDIRDKQCPSIAAMALMGKALNGLQSCDLQKQGNFTVWDSQGILKKR